MEVLALGLTLWMAVATDPAPVPAVTWEQYGVVGLLAAGGLTFGLRTHRREIRRSDELAAELSRVRDAHATELARVRDQHAAELRAVWTDMRDKQVPLLSDTVRILGEVSALIRERR